MKVGDLVTTNRSHVDKSNLFYDCWLRIGIVLSMEINPPTSHGADVEVFWSKPKPGMVSWEDEIALEVLNESG
jgi:hypothetical protein